MAHLDRSASIDSNLLQVQPLRLSKSSSPSPNRMSGSPRPLSEISPSEKRRNSPSTNQTAKVRYGLRCSSRPSALRSGTDTMSQKMTLNTDSSPFQSSPLDGTASPRLFWQNKNNENSVFGRGSPSPTRRSSIERLQKASRVKNSNILALEQKLEYDPTKPPQVERPLSKIQGNAFGATGISGYRDNKGFAHGRSESQTRIPIYNPKSPPPLTRSPPPNGPRPASREQSSPTKSSLASSRFRSSQDRENVGDSDDGAFDDIELPFGRALHRHAKSVTFDAAPPQVNEYEMATPDVSSIATSSREGSYDSEEDDDDYDDHYNIVGSDAHEDSFDAELEDTVKTPVVLPDDWRQDVMNPIDEMFGNSPTHESFPGFAAGAMLQQDRSDSRNSNGDHRPLPPLPPPSGLGDNDGRRNSTSSPGLSGSADRMFGSNRSLPSPPPASSFTKADIQSLGGGKMTLEERLKLMMLSDDGKSAAEQQRERRLRRAGTRDRADSQATEPEAHDVDAAEEDDTLGDLSGLGELQLPAQISRESILRRVDGNNTTDRRPSDYNFSTSSSPERPLPLDPDVPIPSTEDPAMDEDDSNIELKRDYEDGDSLMDQYQDSDSDLDDIDSGDDTEDEEQDEDLVDKADDSESNYSNPGQAPTPQDEKVIEDHLPTPRTATPTQKESSSETVTDGPAEEVAAIQKHNPFTDDLQSFMLPKPTDIEEPETSTTPRSLQRPSTPEHLIISKPEYDGSGWGEPDEYDEEEPRTPDSVIHRPLPEPEEEEARVSPVIPETAATIKSAAGSKLKTRPSATPADIETMREQRRHVSREVPDLSSVPDRQRKYTQGQQLLSVSTSTDEYMQRHPSFKSRSLTLDLDLGLSLDQDFDRVIEAQKVAFSQLSSHQTLIPSSQALLSRQASRARLERRPDLHKNEANSTLHKQRGYLMRQNTKVVTASDKDTEDLRPASRSAGNSPVKQTRPQSWTVEPWNGQVRKKSIRKRSAATGPVPPLPGRESNTAMNPVIEEDVLEDANGEDSGERGRLFVKVLGVKDLDLPIPKSEWTAYL